jgi:hypothetical protein
MKWNERHPFELMPHRLEDKCYDRDRKTVANWGSDGVRTRNSSR